ncbi:18729_t:CDS:1, partial [Gigaspora rosea]
VVNCRSRSLLDGFVSFIMLSDFTVNVAIVGSEFRHWLVMNFSASLSSFLVVKFRHWCDIVAAGVAANVAIAWSEFRR